VTAAEPEIVVVMPCGCDAPRAFVEALEHADQLTALGARRVVAVNASAYFSRPGPRLADGVELLAHILHPDCLPEAPAGAEALTVQLSDTSGGGDAVGAGVPH
jgi:iron complex transport system substrate-binding protein